MPEDTTPLDFDAACGRLDRIVSALAFAKNVPITTTIALDSPTFNGGPRVYKVNLQNGLPRPPEYAPPWLSLCLPPLLPRLGAAVHS